MDENPTGQVIAYVSRHGTTDWNSNGSNGGGKYRGQKDIPLDDKGREDAKEAADFLSKVPIGQAWSSDLSRAKDTAKEILKGRGIKSIPTTALRPLDSGKYTGMSKDDAKEDMKYYQEHTDVRIPGGESIDNMHKRVRPPLFKAFRAGLRTGKPSLLSVHSSVIHSLGHLLHDDHTRALVEPGGVIEVIFDGKKFHAKPIFKVREEDKAKQSAYAS
jgi:broad specificity phosphatase PhoE